MLFSNLELKTYTGLRNAAILAVSPINISILYNSNAYAGLRNAAILAVSPINISILYNSNAYAELRNAAILAVSLQREVGVTNSFV